MEFVFTFSYINKNRNSECTVKSLNKESFESVVMFKHLGTTVTNSLVQISPWELYSQLAKKSSHFFWIVTVQYCVHQSHLPHHQVDPILNQLNTVQTVTPYFHKNHFNITFPYVPRSLKLSLFMKFTGWSFVCTSHLLSVCYISCPSDSWIPAWYLVKSTKLKIKIICMMKLRLNFSNVCYSSLQNVHFPVSNISIYLLEEIT